jgi:hypothetical protein
MSGSRRASQSASSFWDGRRQRFGADGVAGGGGRIMEGLRRLSGRKRLSVLTSRGGRLSRRRFRHPASAERISASRADALGSGSLVTAFCSASARTGAGGGADMGLARGGRLGVGVALREGWRRGNGMLARVVGVLGHEHDVHGNKVGREVGLERELVRQNASARRGQLSPSSSFPEARERTR